MTDRPYTMQAADLEVGHVLELEPGTFPDAEIFLDAGLIHWRVYTLTHDDDGDPVCTLRVEGGGTLGLAFEAAEQVRVVGRHDPSSAPTAAIDAIDDSAIGPLALDWSAVEGDTLRAWRHDVGLSQRALAARLGVTQSTIWKWEARGLEARAIPWVPVLHALTSGRITLDDADPARCDLESACAAIEQLGWHPARALGVRPETLRGWRESSVPTSRGSASLVAMASVLLEDA